MRQILCLVTTLALLTTAQPFAQSAEQDIRKILNDMLAATNAGDKATYGKYLADDLQWVNDQGAIDTKAKRLEGVTGLKVTMRDVDIKVYGDTAIVLGVQGFPNGVQRRMLRVFAKQQGQWKLVRASATRIAAPGKQ